MTHEAGSIDIRTLPEVARLAREVAETRQPRVLRENGEDVAVLVPARPPRRRLTSKATTADDWDAAAALFGAWKGDIDPEEFKRQRRSLQIGDRPAARL